MSRRTVMVHPDIAVYLVNPQAAPNAEIDAALRSRGRVAAATRRYHVLWGNARPYYGACEITGRRGELWELVIAPARAAKNY